MADRQAARQEALFVQAVNGKQQEESIVQSRGELLLESGTITNNLINDKPTTEPRPQPCTADATPR